MQGAVTKEGTVLVEGEYVGRLDGFRFLPDEAVHAEDAKAMMAAARRALAEEIQRRAGALEGDGDGAFTLSSDGLALWRGMGVAELKGGETLLAPRLRLLSSDLVEAGQRDRILARLQRWLDAHLAETLGPLTMLAAAEAPGAARGLAFQVFEAGGSLQRADVADAIAALTREDRKALYGLGVRLGAQFVYVPALLKPRPVALMAVLWSVANGLPLPAPVPSSGVMSTPAVAGVPAAFYRAIGYWLAGSRAIRIDRLEALAAQLFRDWKTWRQAEDARRAAAAAAKAAPAAGEAAIAADPAPAPVEETAAAPADVAAEAPAESLPEAADPAPVDEAPQEAAVVEAAAPAEPEAIEVTEPEAIEVAEPEAVEVTEPEAIEVTEPEAVEVVEPEPVPEAAEAPEPEATEAVEPDQAAPTAPEPAPEPTPEPAPEPAAPAAQAPSADGPAGIRADGAIDARAYAPLVGSPIAEMEPIMRALGFRAVENEEGLPLFRRSRPRPANRGRRDGRRPEGRRPEGRQGDGRQGDGRQGEGRGRQSEGQGDGQRRHDRRQAQARDGEAAPQREERREGRREERKDDRRRREGRPDGGPPPGKGERPDRQRSGPRPAAEAADGQGRPGRPRRGDRPDRFDRGDRDRSRGSEVREYYRDKEPAGSRGHPAFAKLGELLKKK